MGEDWSMERMIVGGRLNGLESSVESGAESLDRELHQALGLGGSGRSGRGAP
jgi:hypothetical protein